jgi:predicted transcriptional regulator
MIVSYQDNMVADNVCAVREIDYTKKLPDAEYEVMQAIWTGEPPLNTAYLMEQVGRERGWKAPTLISFLVRLEDRGYITSVKRGKERYYTPVADRDTYLRAVSEQFIAQYHGGSFVRMMDALYNEKKLSEADIDDLLQWLKSKY